MLKATPPPVPAKSKRRRISAVRNFPQGCRALAAEPGPNPAGRTRLEPEHAKLEPLPSHRKEEPEESHGSSLLEKEPKKASEEETDGKLEASGESHGSTLPEKGIEKRSEEDEASELPEVKGQLKRRKVSAVRHFPSGCGRNVAEIGLEESAVAASSESKTKGRIETVVESAAKDDDNVDEVRKSDIKSEDFFESSSEEDENAPMPIREKKVQDSRFKSPKPRNFQSNTSFKESREVRPPFGTKLADKGLVTSMRKPMDNVNTLKRKSNEEVEGVKARRKEFLEARGDGSPKFKAKDKQKMFSRSAFAPRNDGNGKAAIVSKKSKQPSDGASPRDMVKRTLRLFQKLLEEDETKSKGTSRVDLNAASILKESNNWVNYGAPIIGDVPGVEAGDEFHWRVELSIIGLHRPFQGGIDFMKRGDGKILATSIVASGGYPDGLESSGELIYSGSGGNPDAKKKKEAGDQKLERGNLALKNSIDARTPVRVIYGSKDQHRSTYRDGRAKMVTTFIYDGLYLVEECWSEAGPRGFSVYKFRLRRLPRTQNTRGGSDSDRE